MIAGIADIGGIGGIARMEKDRVIWPSDHREKRKTRRPHAVAW